MADHLRNDEDVEAILRIAVRGESASGEGLRERLSAAADELGITPDQLAKAEEEYRRQVEGSRLEEISKQEDAELWKKFRKAQLHEFTSHLGTFLAVNAGLFAIDLITGGGIDWAYFPFFGWGIAVGIHMFTFLSAYSNENQSEFEKWKRKKIRREQKTNSLTTTVSKASVDDEVAELMISGQKIEAIKLVRESTGMGLAEAKEYVEQLEANY